MTSLLRLNGERLGCRLSNRGTTPENALLYFFFFSFLPKSCLRVTQYARTHPMHIDCPFGRFNQYLPGLSQLAVVRDFRSRNHLRVLAYEMDCSEVMKKKLLYHPRNLSTSYLLSLISYLSFPDRGVPCRLLR